MMAVNPEKKERTIKGDQCDLAKDPPTVKILKRNKELLKVTNVT